MKIVPVRITNKKTANSGFKNIFWNNTNII